MIPLCAQSLLIIKWKDAIVSSLPLALDILAKNDWEYNSDNVFIAPL